MSQQRPPPPEKIRTTGLQEAQLLTLQAIEQRCAEMYYQAGLGAEQYAPRSEVALAKLPRQHDVMVAEADDEPTGFLVWADEAPGVAHLVTLLVSPARHRCGIGTHLLRELGQSANRHGIKWAITACWDCAPWALSFLAVRGFEPLETAAPNELIRWAERRGDEILQPGQRFWWARTDGLGTVPGLPRP